MPFLKFRTEIKKGTAFYFVNWPIYWIIPGQNLIFLILISHWYLDLSPAINDNRCTQVLYNNTSSHQTEGNLLKFLYI